MWVRTCGHVGENGRASSAASVPARPDQDSGFSVWPGAATSAECLRPTARPRDRGSIAGRTNSTQTSTSPTRAARSCQTRAHPAARPPHSARGVQARCVSVPLTNARMTSPSTCGNASGGGRTPGRGRCRDVARRGDTQHRARPHTSSASGTARRVTSCCMVAGQRVRTQTRQAAGNPRSSLLPLSMHQMPMAG